MLHIVYGPAGSGKTTHIFNSIKKCAAGGGHSVLIVPEQYSATAELAVFDAGLQQGNVNVFSFTSFAEAVARRYGGLAKQELTEPGRAVFVRRAIDELGGAIKYFAQYRRNTEFCAMCAEALFEIKTAGISPEGLFEISDKIEDSDKLKELALIYSAYEGLVAQKYEDALDKLMSAALSAEADYFSGTHYFFDEFDGFTHPQYLVLQKAMQYAASCTVALSCDTLNNKNGASLFSAVQAVAARLIAYAHKSDVAVAAPLNLGMQHRFSNAQLAQVESFLRFGTDVAGGAETALQPGQGVFINKFETVYDEVRYVAAAIKKLVLQGARYSEIAVVAREAEPYRAPVRTYFYNQNIRYFMDENKTIEHSAPAIFIRSALALAKGGIQTRELLRFFKTGLCAYDDSAISAFENYAYTWQLKFERDFVKPFTLSPAGLGDMDEKLRAELAPIEAVRADAITKLVDFFGKAKRTSGRLMSQYIYNLFEAFGAQGAAAQRHDYLSKHAPLEADTYMQAYNACMALLDEMAKLLGDDDVSAAEYDELFALLLRTTRVGDVQKAVDCVQFSTAERMRLEEKKYMFVLGANEGIFPKQITQQTLLTHRERDELIMHGADLIKRFEALIVNEELYFYRALTNAQQGLFISYVEAAGGEQLSENAFVKGMVETFNFAPFEVEPQYFAATVPAALDSMGELAAGEAASLRKALEQLGEAQALAVLESAAPAQFKVEDTALIKNAVGKSLYIAPTNAESFFKCGFAHFMRYTLKVRPRNVAELSSLESGTFVHHILEQAVKTPGFEAMDEREIKQLSDRIADAYIEKTLPQEILAAARIKTLIARVKANTAKLLRFVQQEQQQSLFKIYATEVKIERGGDVEPLGITLPTGEQINIVGKVDRLDVMEKQGQKYIRVVDYKTGAVEFSLDNVFYGLNAQALMYLFAISASEGELQGAKPAAALYLISDPAPQQGNRGEAQKTAYGVDGLILNDDAVLSAMEVGKGGVFIPIKYNLDGKPASRQKALADLETFGRIERHLTALFVKMGSAVYAGEIAAMPLVDGNKSACDYCDYYGVCRHEEGVGERLFQKLGKTVFGGSADE